VYLKIYINYENISLYIWVVNDFCRRSAHFQANKKLCCTFYGQKCLLLSCCCFVFCGFFDTLTNK